MGEKRGDFAGDFGGERARGGAERGEKPRFSRKKHPKIKH